MLFVDQLRRSDPPLRALAIAVLAGLGLLAAGLWYVQVVSAARYRASLENQSFRSVRLPAIRGKIFDRRGEALAENTPRYTVNLYLEELSKSFQSAYGAELARVRSQLGRKLTREEQALAARTARFLVTSNVVQLVSTALEQPLTLNEARFHQHYEQRLALPMPVADNLTPERIARFVERAPRVPGVELEIQPARVYPRGALAAHTVGFMRYDDSSAEEEEAFFHYRLPDYRGVSGIEGAFDRDLRGRAGGKSMLVNNLGYRQTENAWSQPLPGRNITLTIDARLQRAAEDALRAHGADTRGAIVVLDPRTGDVLAAASAPVFDPNIFTSRISHEEMARLNDTHLRPQINRVTYGAYPPGSIFKIIVALAALDAGVLNPADTVFNSGDYHLGRRKIHDPAPVGKHDFRSAFIHSSNTYFIHYGLKAGIRRILELGARFQLGTLTGLMPRQEVAGEIPTYADVLRGWSDGDTANVSLGQGAITVTPVQMAVMTAAVANGGKVFAPRLVRRIDAQDEEDTDVSAAPASARVRAELGLRPEHLELIRAAMLADVESGGTGARALVPGMSIGGKTGTAEITQGSRKTDKVTWFVSFAPYEAPRYVVVAMVESGASGGATCAPMVAKVYQAIQKLEAGGGSLAMNN